MANEIREKLVLDGDEAIGTLKGIGDAAVKALGKDAAGGAEAAQKAFEDAKEEADLLARELEKLDKRARLTRAKGESSEFAAKTKELREAQRLLRQPTEKATKVIKDQADASRSASSEAREFGSLALLNAQAAVSLARSVLDGARALQEFALAGAHAADTSARFAALAGGAAPQARDLAAATAGVVDETTLQNYAILAERAGLSAEQMLGLAQRVTVAAERHGELANVGEILNNTLRGELEGLKKVGIFVDLSAVKYAGMTETVKKQRIAMDLASEGNQAQVDSLESLEVQMLQASAASENATQNLSVLAAQVLESSGAIDAMTTGLQDLNVALGGQTSAQKEAAQNGRLLIKTHAEEAIELENKISNLEEALRLNSRLYSPEQRAATQAQIDALKAEREEVRELINRRRVLVEIRERDLAAKKASDEQVRTAAQQEKAVAESADKAYARRLQAERSLAEMNARSDAAEKRRDEAKAAREAAKGVDELAQAFERLRDAGGAWAGERMLPDVGGLVGQAKAAAADVRSVFSDTLSGVGEEGAWGRGSLFGTPDVVGGLGGLGESLLGGFGDLADSERVKTEEALDATKAKAEQTAESFESLGRKLGDVFGQMAQGSFDFAQTTTSLLGDLFEKVAQNLLQWAVTQGALLSGNFVLAIAGATAMLAASGAIRGFGAGGGGGGAGTATGPSQAQRVSEFERQRRDNQRGVLEINLHGIPVPDATARELGAAVARDLQLRGFEAA